MILTHHHLIVISNSLLHHPRERVSNSFIVAVKHFSSGLPFCPSLIKPLGCLELFSSSPLRVDPGESSPLTRPPCPLPGRLDCHLIGMVVGEGPFNPSFETHVLRWAMALPDQPPPPDHLENHQVWVDSIKVIPLGLMQNVPWVYSSVLHRHRGGRI
jgi:hypothetical protein